MRCFEARIIKILSVSLQITYLKENLFYRDFFAFDSKVKKKEQNVFAYIIFSMLYTIQSIAIWMLII